MMRQREAESGPALALGIVALLVIGIGALVLSGQFIQVSIPRSLAHIVEPTLPSRPVDGAVPVTKLSAAALAVSPIDIAAVSLPATDAASTAESAPSEATVTSDRALAAGGRAHVANTDGQGVVLYAAPRPSARQPAGLLEGTPVTVLEMSGSEWARVQTSSRQAGWVHAEFLAPAAD